MHTADYGGDYSELVSALQAREKLQRASSGRAAVDVAAAAAAAAPAEAPMGRMSAMPEATQHVVKMCKAFALRVTVRPAVLCVSCF